MERKQLVYEIKQLEKAIVLREAKGLDVEQLKIFRREWKKTLKGLPSE